MTGFVVAFIAGILPIISFALRGEEVVGAGGGGCIVIFFFPICFTFGTPANISTLLLVLTIALALVVMVIGYLIYREMRKHIVEEVLKQYR